jgi:hypothetical protein
MEKIVGFQHEYGHYLQSRAVGAGFLLMFGLPSIISAAGSGSHTGYTEQDAEARSRTFFDDLGVTWRLGSVDKNFRVNYSNCFSYIF